MAEHSAIEWTDSTWNPIVGCSIVSPGCTNCYAMGMAARIEAMSLAEARNTHYFGTTKRVKGTAVWTGKLALAPDHILTAPLHWKKPRRVFVNSMGDLFHEDAPDEWIDRCFAVMALSPQHTFQVLTKRPERMREYATLIDNEPVRDTVRRIVAAWPGNAPIPAEITFPLPNVWLGTSCERQQEADERIPLLLDTPAVVRFVSLEPLLGPIDLRTVISRDGRLGKFVPFNSLAAENWTDGRPVARLDWVIVGGESGPSARPMSIQWARELRDQCAAAGVRYFFKQWGEWAPAMPVPSETPGRFAFGDYEYDREQMIQTDHYPRQFTKFGARSVMDRVGKRAAGRLLDGREWSEFPGKASS